MENNKELERVEVVNINYTQPKFWHRVMANFIDFFLFLVMGISLFIGVRTIVINTPAHKAADQTMVDVQLSSGLYIKDVNDEGRIIDVVAFTNKYYALYGNNFEGTPDGDKVPEEKIGRVVYAINSFINYCHDESIVSKERYDDLLYYYDSARLDTVTSDGIHYFIKDGDNILLNETLSSNPEKRKLYYENVYVPLIEKKFLPFLTSNVKPYHEAYIVERNFLIFLELPVAYVLAAILVYYIPPLFIKRGRKTLGKAIYQIGLVDDRLLSPTAARFTARFAILLFAELILSLFSFGIPYIISFSMMAFSKRKQGFPDYMLHLYEIDTSKANIYLDYVEAQLKNELHGEAIDFRMEKPL